MLGLPNFLRHDEVPAEAKAAPRIVETPPPLTGDEAWPRLGDVPFKPETFSPKPVYDHYMNELEYQRAIGRDAQQKLESYAPERAVLDNEIPGASPLTPVPLPLTAPQLPKE
jgi:hypothetical protein